MFNDIDITVPCPHCGHKTKKRVSWLKTNDKLACRCGKTFTIDAKPLLEGLDDARKSLDDLKRNLGKIFK